MEEIEGGLKSLWPQSSIHPKVVATLMPSGAMMLLESEIIPPPGDNYQHAPVAAQRSHGASFQASENEVVVQL